MKRVLNFIDGQFRPPCSGRYLPDVDLLEQDALDLDDAPEPQDRLAELFLRDGGGAECREHRVELPEDLLEPELVGLVWTMMKSISSWAGFPWSALSIRWLPSSRSS